MTLAMAAAGDVRRDVRVMSLIGTAHFSSHFYQLMLPPLFPLLAEQFGVGYVTLGLIPAVFFSTSGVCQTIAGFMVDRFGARNVLIAGLALLAAAVACTGLATEFWMLLPIACLAGAGNSVFHPADLAILNASVHTSRLGRAFSVHGIGGNLGWATAPACVIALTALVGWRPALLILGCLGLAVAAFLASQSGAFVDHRKSASAQAAARASSGLGDDVRLLLVAPVVLCFAFFTLYAMAFIGLQTFSVTALVEMAGLPLEVASGVLTGFLVASTAGVLAGGIVADRYGRHTLVAVAGMAGGGVFSLLLILGTAPMAAIVAIMAATGFCLGITGPSRDLLVRSAAPVNATGKVYGFVYSGLDLGSALIPLLFGWLIDHGQPRAVFLSAAVLMLLSILTLVQVRRRAVPRPAA